MSVFVAVERIIPKLYDRELYDPDSVISSA